MKLILFFSLTLFILHFMFAIAVPLTAESAQIIPTARQEYATSIPIDRPGDSYGSHSSSYSSYVCELWRRHYKQHLPGCWYFSF